jgi:very-short-patch-repair endonuclease
MRDESLRSRQFAKVLRTRMTDAETILWSQLREWREHSCAFRRQHPIGPYVADFACGRAKIVVELDGDQHGSDANHVYDLRRDAYMTARGWRVIRVSNDQIYKDLGSVLNMLADAIPPPSPDGDTSPAIPISRGVKARSPRGRKDI